MNYELDMQKYGIYGRVEKTKGEQRCMLIVNWIVD